MKNIINFTIAAASLFITTSINAQTSYTLNADSSNHTIAVGSSMQPDSIGNFSGAWNGDAVTFTWNTQQELNSLNFIIEKSSNGSDWQTLGTAVAAGNSNLATVYYYSDADPYTVTYYRLKQVDINGAYVYAKVLRMAKEENAFSITVSPNQLTSKVTIVSTSPVNKEVSIKIYSSNGILVKEMAKHVKAGVNNFEVRSLNTLTNDTYTVVMSDNKDLVFASFTKQ